MRPGKMEVLEWERRWATPAAFAAFAALIAVVIAIVVTTQVVGSGGGDSQLLRNVNSHRTAQMMSSILQALGVGLISLPLYYLFRAARARSPKMRGQLVGIVVTAPLFLAVTAVLNGVVTLEAANEFVSNHIPTLIASGAALHSNRANEVANNVVTNSSLQPVSAVFGLVGALGFVVAMVYTSLHAMRSGLLTRFWGSLGIALGAVSFLPLPPFYLFWFVYLGLLLLGRVPGGRPPAWAAGEAIPWPTPGEKAAASLNPPPEGDDVEQTALTNGTPPEEASVRERRKRKQRD
jgi:hypothetical protein